MRWQSEKYDHIEGCGKDGKANRQINIHKTDQDMYRHIRQTLALQIFKSLIVKRYPGNLAGGRQTSRQLAHGITSSKHRSESPSIVNVGWWVLRRGGDNSKSTVRIGLCDTANDIHRYYNTPICVTSLCAKIESSPRSDTFHINTAY